MVVQAELDLTGKTTFAGALSAWLARAQEIIDKNYVGHTFPAPRLSPEFGRRYVRVVREEIGKDGQVHGRSVHVFIDTTNGDVLKAASWKGPAKHARGNIFKGRDGVGAYGAHYL